MSCELLEIVRAIVLGVAWVGKGEIPLPRGRLPVFLSNPRSLPSNTMAQTNSTPRAVTMVPPWYSGVASR